MAQNNNVTGYYQQFGNNKINSRDDYEVSPAPPFPASSASLPLQSVDVIDPNYREIFQKFPYFNHIQSQVLNDALHTDEPLVVAAPTGSGKTVIFELAIVRFLMHSNNLENKIVYIAPMKSLCEERLIDWHQKFSKFNLACISVTGDSDNVDFQSLLNHNLIITTPEKWDSLTRKWRDNKKLVQLVKLFMIDEVHLLNEDGRGATLEVVITRMKTIQDYIHYDCENYDDSKDKIRFLTVSATIPNIEDLAEWIGMLGNPAKYYKFGDEFRPVPLKKFVFGYPYNRGSNPFKFDLALNYKLQTIILQHANCKPVLIFCSTRKSVEMTSKHLSQTLNIQLEASRQLLFESSVANIADQKLRQMLLSGIGCHHAGMDQYNRKTIEDLFRSGNLPVLVTTSTLSMGVNLPAHLVIIKSTKIFMKGEYRDYDECMLLQMIGRAGRPQFDVEATVVIMTTACDQKKYENMIGGQQVIESNLHKHLIEHVNAEVALRTISNLGVATQWLISTFLRIRIRKNPKHYGLPLGLSPDQIDQKLLDMCQTEIHKLAHLGMLTIGDDLVIAPTANGSLMAKYYIAFDTMKLFLQITGKEVLQQILDVISRCHEFSELYLRVNDKKTLNLLNNCKTRETIRFPLLGKIKSLDMKINCLIQAAFGNLQISEPSLINETQKVLRIGERITKCLVEYLELKSDCYSALLSALTLSKCFHAVLWDNSPFVTRQLSKIGAVLSTLIANSGRTTFQSLIDTDPRVIEMTINRKPPLGTAIIHEVEHLPQYALKLESSGAGIACLKLDLKNFVKLKQNSTVNIRSGMILIVGDQDNNILLYEKYTLSQMIKHPVVVKEIKLLTKVNVTANFISEDWVGIDGVATLSLNPKPPSGPTTLAPIKSKKTPVASKEQLKITASSKGEPKTPSHIQTFMELYFKQSKGMKRTRASSKEKATVVKSAEVLPIEIEEFSSDDVTGQEDCLQLEQMVNENDASKVENTKVYKFDSNQHTVKRTESTNPCIADIIKSTELELCSNNKLDDFVNWVDVSKVEPIANQLPNNEINNCDPLYLPKMEQTKLKCFRSPEKPDLNISIISDSGLCDDYECLESNNSRDVPSTSKNENSYQSIHSNRNVKDAPSTSSNTQIIKPKMALSPYNLGTFDQPKSSSAKVQTDSPIMPALLNEKDKKSGITPSTFKNVNFNIPSYSNRKLEDPSTSTMTKTELNSSGLFAYPLHINLPINNLNKEQIDESISLLKEKDEKYYMTSSNSKLPTTIPQKIFNRQSKNTQSNQTPSNQNNNSKTGNIDINTQSRNSRIRNNDIRYENTNSRTQNQSTSSQTQRSKPKSMTAQSNQFHLNPVSASLKRTKFCYRVTPTKPAQEAPESIDRFKFSDRKRFSHESNISDNTQDLESTYSIVETFIPQKKTKSENDPKKTLTWRSPLVTLPEGNNNKSPDSSLDRGTGMILLSDRDYNKYKKKAPVSEENEDVLSEEVKKILPAKVVELCMSDRQNSHFSNNLYHRKYDACGDYYKMNLQNKGETTTTQKVDSPLLTSNAISNTIFDCSPNECISEPLNNCSNGFSDESNRNKAQEMFEKSLENIVENDILQFTLETFVPTPSTKQLKDSMAQKLHQQRKNQSRCLENQRSSSALGFSSNYRDNSEPSSSRYEHNRSDHSEAFSPGYMKNLRDHIAQVPLSIEEYNPRDYNEPSSLGDTHNRSDHSEAFSPGYMKNLRDHIAQVPLSIEEYNPRHYNEPSSLGYAHNLRDHSGPASLSRYEHNPRDHNEPSLLGYAHNLRDYSEPASSSRYEHNPRDRSGPTPSSAYAHNFQDYTNPPAQNAFRNTYHYMSHDNAIQSTDRFRIGSKSRFRDQPNDEDCYHPLPSVEDNSFARVNHRPLPRGNNYPAPNLHETFYEISARDSVNEEWNPDASGVDKQYIMNRYFNSMGFPFSNNNNLGYPSDDVPRSRNQTHHEHDNWRYSSRDRRYSDDASHYQSNANVTRNRDAWRYSSNNSSSRNRIHSRPNSPNDNDLRNRGFPEDGHGSHENDVWQGRSDVDLRQPMNESWHQGHQ